MSSRWLKTLFIRFTLFLIVTINLRGQKTSTDGGGGGGGSSTISDKGPVLAMVMTWAAVVYATLTLLYWFR